MCVKYDESIVRGSSTGLPPGFIFASDKPKTDRRLDLKMGDLPPSVVERCVVGGATMKVICEVMTSDPAPREFETEKTVAYVVPAAEFERLRALEARAKTFAEWVL